MHSARAQFKTPASAPPRPFPRPQTLPSTTTTNLSNSLHHPKQTIFNMPGCGTAGCTCADCGCAQGACNCGKCETTLAEQRCSVLTGIRNSSSRQSTWQQCLSDSYHARLGSSWRQGPGLRIYPWIRKRIIKQSLHMTLISSA